LRFFILGAAAAWGIYKAAMIGAAIVSNIMGLAHAVRTLMMMQKGMNAAQALFNVLLMANPVGLAIAAIAILVGLFALAYHKCEPFRNMVNSVLEKLKALGVHIMQVLSPALEVVKGVFQKVITVLGSMFSTGMRIITLLFDLFNITNQTGESFSYFDMILNGFSIGVQVVWTLLGGVVDTIGALYDGINNVISAFQNGGFIAGIKQIGISLLNYLLTPIRAVLEAISNIPGIGDIAKKGAEKIAQFQDFLRAETEKNTGLENGPVEAAAPAVEAASPPAPITNPASKISPAITGPIADAQGSMRQPALLNLQEGRLFRAGPGPQSLATPTRTASLWKVPVENEYPETDIAPAITEFSAQTAISAASAAAERIVPPAIEAVSVPIKYDFPEMIIPPDLIRPVLVPVSWVYPEPPEAPFTTTAGRATAGQARTTSSISRGRPRRRFSSVPAAPAAAGRIIPPAITNSDPAGVNRIVPPAAESPIAPSVGAALIPPATAMTRAEQMAAEQILYSKTETREKIDLTISLDKGLEAKEVNPPKSPNVKLEISGTV
jgi:hypothetical protein